VSLHRRTDRQEERKSTASDSRSGSDVAARERKQLKKLRRVSRKLKHFLATNEEKIGTSGDPIQSNVTDNESAKMKTNRGVIQGYIGVAGVDAKSQVVVDAEGAYVLRGLVRRGMKASLLTVGDGALGFWAAVRNVSPETRHELCWVHKLENVLDKLPRRRHGRAASRSRAGRRQSLAA
jgi:hypothetical protein